MIILKNISQLGGTSLVSKTQIPLFLIPSNIPFLTIRITVVTLTIVHLYCLEIYIMFFKIKMKFVLLVIIKKQKNPIMIGLCGKLFNTT